MASIRLVVVSFVGQAVKHRRRVALFPITGGCRSYFHGSSEYADNKAVIEAVEFGYFKNCRGNRSEQGEHYQNGFVLRKE